MTKPYTPTSERFWKYVTKKTINECWEWSGARDQCGYGVLRRDPAHRSAQCHASRISWEIHNGKIPDGLQILHRCDNPPCVNPSHLWIGTNAQNIADAIAKGRKHKSFCRRGHQMVPGNIGIQGANKRRCLTCNRLREAARKARNPELERSKKRARYQKQRLQAI